jgi:4'-phosphopantetheinyl transferase
MGTDARFIEETLDDWRSRHAVFGTVQELPAVWRELKRGVLPAFSARELDILNRHRHPVRRASWVAGRLAARRAIAKYCRQHQEVGSRWEILRSPWGAPEISGRQDLCLSISHAGSLAIAVVGSRPLGIDLERQDDRPQSLGRAFFSDDEYSWTRCEPLLCRRRCNELWTRKEAVAKLLGKGAHLNFSRLPVLDWQAPWRILSTSSLGYAVSLAMNLEA